MVIGILDQQFLRSGDRLRIIAAIQVVGLEDTILRIQNIAAVADHCCPRLWSLAPERCQSKSPSIRSVLMTQVATFLIRSKEIRAADQSRHRASPAEHDPAHYQSAVTSTSSDPEMPPGVCIEAARYRYDRRNCPPDEVTFR